MRKPEPPEQRKIREARRYGTRRTYAEELLGNRCSAKGCQRVDALRLSGPKPFASIYAISLDRLNEELQSFRLTCPDHRGAYKVRHYCYTTYFKRKCRCDECCEWHADYLLRLREDQERASSMKEGLANDQEDKGSPNLPTMP